ncbi:MAG: carboxypeptidase regulatory-like domain-containing protein [Acidobacteriota bacterium]
MVVDTDGGVIPGADVVVRNERTGEVFSAVTSGQGVFSVPSLITGTYSVTVSIQGFKTVVLNNVVVNAGVPASVRATLEVGGLAETVLVQSTSELIQTQSATVATTLNSRQVANLPLSSRNAADFITFLPGVSTAGGSRDSIVNGLPQSTINMTLDGVNIQDNTLVGRVTAEVRLDALNVFNHVNFSPVSGISIASNRSSGAAQTAYEVTGLTGTNTARVVQLVARLRF